MPARFFPRPLLFPPLAALLLAAPSVVRGQASSSVVARARVVSAEAPHLGLSLAAIPSVEATPQPAAGAATGASSDVVEVTSIVRVRGNVGYRLLVHARDGAAKVGLSVRDAAGAFRPLAAGEAVEVARGRGLGRPRAVVYRVKGAIDATEPPVVYELVYDPVS